MKHRIWIKRRDKIRQRYWVGRSRKKNYGAFKFVSPWQQLQKEGRVEPDYARFGTRNLKVGDEREMLRLQKELSVLQRSKAERERIIKQLETPPKVKFEEELPRKQPKQALQILEIKRKVEEITPEKIVQRHKTEAGELRKQEKEDLKERFIREKQLSQEAASIAIQKYDSLLKQDPKGRSIGIDYIFNRAAKLAKDEEKGKQKVITGVKTYSDPEYIKEIEQLGFNQHDAQNLFFNLPSEDVINKTPQQVAKMVAKIPEFEMKEGSIVESRQKTPTAEEASEMLDELIKFRPDLKQHNKVSLINKLRLDIGEAGDMLHASSKQGQIHQLVTFFSHDKKLKDTLKDEKQAEAE